MRHPQRNLLTYSREFLQNQKENASMIILLYHKRNTLAVKSFFPRIWDRMKYYLTVKLFVALENFPFNLGGILSGP